MQGRPAAEACYGLATNNIMEAVVGWIPNYDYYDDGYGDYQMNMELDRDNMEYLIRLKRMSN